MTDYVLYGLPLGSPSAEPTCQGLLGSGTLSTVATLPEGAFLVVARNAVGEGSYGRSSDGSQRPSAGPGLCPQEQSIPPETTRRPGRTPLPRNALSPYRRR